MALAALGLDPGIGVLPQPHVLDRARVCVRNAFREEAEMSELSDFNTVLNQVLNLAEATTKESALTEPDTAEWHRCTGRLAALRQVIGFFSEVDGRRFGPHCKSATKYSPNRYGSSGFGAATS